MSETKADGLSHSLVDILSSTVSNADYSLIPFDQTKGPKWYLWCFTVGVEKIKVYGNPAVMGTNAEFWTSFVNTMGSESKDHTAELATHMKVMEHPEAFITVWCRMNGITDKCLDLLYDRVSQPPSVYLKVWEWLKYFDAADSMIDDDELEIVQECFAKEMREWKKLNKPCIDKACAMFKMTLEMTKTVDRIIPALTDAYQQVFQLKA